MLRKSVVSLISVSSILIRDDPNVKKIVNQKLTWLPLKTKTPADPKAVTAHVKSVPRNACRIGCASRIIIEVEILFYQRS